MSNRLQDTVARAEREFSAFADEETNSAKPGVWSRKQILGHLIDSASNNHQRFVRAILQEELVWPNYDPEGSVRAQCYQNLSWSNLVEFWAGYNRFLAHVLAGVPEAKLKTRCVIGNYPPMTLEALANDYLHHLEHHLEQIRSRT